MRKIDRDGVLRLWEARGYRAGGAAEEAWSDRLQTSEQLFMVLEGQVELEVDGTLMRPLPGEEIYIPANAVHSLRDIGGGASWLYVLRGEAAQSSASRSDAQHPDAHAIST